jgi:hypothetical protein
MSDRMKNRLRERLEVPAADAGLTDIFFETFSLQARRSSAVKLLAAAGCCYRLIDTGNLLVPLVALRTSPVRHGIH